MAESMQRNNLDVALELTQLYYKNTAINSPEELEMTYAKFHTLVYTLQSNNYRNFIDLLPEDIKKVIEKK